MKLFLFPETNKMTFNLDKALDMFNEGFKFTELDLPITDRELEVIDEKMQIEHSETSIIPSVSSRDHIEKGNYYNNHNIFLHSCVMRDKFLSDNVKMYLFITAFPVHPSARMYKWIIQRSNELLEKCDSPYAELYKTMIDTYSSMRKIWHIKYSEPSYMHLNGMIEVSDSEPTLKNNEKKGPVIVADINYSKDKAASYAQFLDSMGTTKPHMAFNLVNATLDEMKDTPSFLTDLVDFSFYNLGAIMSMVEKEKGYHEREEGWENLESVFI